MSGAEEERRRIAARKAARKAALERARAEAAARKAEAARPASPTRGAHNVFATMQAKKKRDTRVVEALTQQLAAADTADDMFRAFAQFNALFFRPRVRAAVQQFQARLVTTVERDLKALQQQFMGRYSRSEAAVMARVRELPLARQAYFADVDSIVTLNLISG